MTKEKTVEQLLKEMQDLVTQLLDVANAYESLLDNLPDDFIISVEVDNERRD